MTLTGMKKHVGVLEQAGLVTTEKLGRVRTCNLGPRRLEEETAWLERYRQLWDARFDELDKVVEEIAELQAENSTLRVEEEFGDVIFSLMQWARKKGVDPDRAMRRQMMRFKGRFEKVEDDAKANGGWDQRTLDQMEAAWQAAKKAADFNER